LSWWWFCHGWRSCGSGTWQKASSVFTTGGKEGFRYHAPSIDT
jgi:hypothetical protein